MKDTKVRHRGWVYEHYVVLKEKFGKKSFTIPEIKEKTGWAVGTIRPLLVQLRRKGYVSLSGKVDGEQGRPVNIYFLHDIPEGEIVNKPRRDSSLGGVNLEEVFASIIKMRDKFGALEQEVVQLRLNLDLARRELAGYDTLKRKFSELINK